jgi:hypothetical protein
MAEASFRLSTHVVVGTPGYNNGRIQQRRDKITNPLAPGGLTTSMARTAAVRHLTIVKGIGSRCG